MAKSHKAAVAFDIGGDPATHYEPGDSFPSDSPHLTDLVKGGYVSEQTGTGTKGEKSEPIDPATNLPVKDSKVYEENEGSVADVMGNEIDVVGFQTPDAADVQKQTPAQRAGAAKKAAPKSTSAKRTSAKRTGVRSTRKK